MAHPHHGMSIPTDGASYPSRAVREGVRYLRVPTYAEGVAIDISLDEALALVTVRFVGTIRLADFQSSRATLAATPGWSPALTHVLDLTAVEHLELSHEDVKLLATAPLLLDSLQILVARPNSVHFGIARMFQIYADGRRQVRVVATMEEALSLAATC